MIRVRSAGVAALTAVALGVLVACAPATIIEPNVTVSPTPDTSRAPAPSPPPDPKPAVAWPLTGLDATTASATELARPAISVKIENTEAARPPTNLHHADVVFEENVEYGISRLIAVYQSDYPEQVGPIRSMRPMDRNIIGSYGGPLVFSGAQRRFINQAADSGITLIAQDVGSYGFFRTSDKPAPHNLHGYLADFAEQAEGAVAPAAQWAFAYPGEMASAAVNGKPTSVIDIRFSSYSHPHWKWSEKNQLWMRYEYDDPHKTDDGTQLSATNVVIIWVTVQETGATNQGMSVPETLVAGKSGKGWAATGGKRIAIEWSKAGQFDPFVIVDGNGDAVSLAPGQTWWELVPTNGEFATKVSFE
jgi:hypothetical protein